VKNRAAAVERANQLRAVLDELNDGRSLRAIAHELYARGIATARGG